jgi:DNA-binding transcriptional regulator/RsmH inhibitor MraZ
VKITDSSYLGYSAYKMDPKYRVSIPTAWRPAAGQNLYLLSSRTHDMPMVKVLSQEAYDGRVRDVHESGYTPARKRALLSTLSMLSREASVNDQGKLLVPKELSESCGIAADSEVMLVGRGLHFEVWNKQSHAIALEIERAQVGEDELGIF